MDFAVSREIFGSPRLRKGGTQDDRSRYEKEVSSAQHFRQAFANSTLEPSAITALLQRLSYTRTLYITRTHSL